MTTTRVLVTGFEAFAGAASNPSGEVVRRLVSVPQPELAEAGVEVRGVVLPVSYRASGPALMAAIEAHAPNVVIALGLAEGRSGITPEIMKQALAQAKDGRLHILGEMAKSLTSAQAFSEYAPKIETMSIPTDKIREVIGSGGKVIREIVEKTGAKINIEDDGTVKVASE